MQKKDSIGTLIFDEIDTGVSGRAAQKIGIKLKQISRLRQVLCVTHLAQMAVMADNHLLIEKNIQGNRTVTTVRTLDHEQRKYEIARIMGGENITELIDLPISVQRVFLDVLNAQKFIGLNATENNILTPRKSVTAIIGLSENEISKGRRGCACCNMREVCQFRKKRRSLWILEHYLKQKNLSYLTEQWVRCFRQRDLKWVALLKLLT